MAAITATLSSAPKLINGSIVRYSGTSTANQTDTLTSTVVPTGGCHRLCYVTVSYSATPVQTGVTIAIDSSLGANFDTTIYTGAANVTDTIYFPDDTLWLLPGDAIVVTAPAAGGSITSNIVIVLEQG